jgi:hypothetical protein
MPILEPLFNRLLPAYTCFNNSSTVKPMSFEIWRSRIISSRMHWNRCAAAIRVSELFVRFPLPNFREAQGVKNRDDLAPFKEPGSYSCSANCDRLRADKLRL